MTDDELYALTEAACRARSTETMGEFMDRYHVGPADHVLHDERGTWFWVTNTGYGSSSRGWARSTDGKMFEIRHQR